MTTSQLPRAAPRLAVGDRLPEAKVWTMGPEGPRPQSIAALFAGRCGVLFAVPAAFSPTCSDVHLPGFLALADELAEAGAALIACVAVNDAWTMAAWGRQQQVGERVVMLADANRDFTAAAGMELDLSRFGDGLRSRRYAAILDDGVVRWLAAEEGPGATVSNAEATLAALRGSSAGSPG